MVKYQVAALIEFPAESSDKNFLLEMSRSLIEEKLGPGYSVRYLIAAKE
jgi:hypothetical protein